MPKKRIPAKKTAGKTAMHGGFLPPNIGVIQLPPPPLNPPSMELLHSYTDWRRDWTHIVAGKFTDSPYSALLFYEASTGVAEFYSTDGSGGINLLKHHEGWRQSWTHIVAGYFASSTREGILLYDQSAGFGAFYDTDGHGNIILLREQPQWRTTWTHILAAKFTKSPRSSLLFCAVLQYRRTWWYPASRGILGLANKLDANRCR
jgi:hypothetical protein